MSTVRSDPPIRPDSTDLLPAQPVQAPDHVQSPAPAGRNTRAAARPQGPEAVRITGLTKSFGTKQAVCDLDLSIVTGDVVALLGPNGAGKSTTIDMLLGLTSPDSGEIAVFGANPRAAIAQGAVGAMLQSGGFLGAMTGREIVTVIARQFPQPLAVDEALDLAGIREKAKSRYSGMSGGEKQRIRFAAAVACNPRLLVLDEPTVAMDVEGRRDFWAAMKEFAAGGRTVVFATHYLAEAEDFARRIVLLRDGRLVADGTLADIRSSVPGRIVSAEIPGANPDRLRTLPGVADVRQDGARVFLHCNDSDAALRALFGSHNEVHDVEVAVASLEEAFVALTTTQQSGRTN